jgi:hypothetical protein
MSGTLLIVKEIVEDLNKPTLTKEQLNVFKKTVEKYSTATIRVVTYELIQNANVKNEEEAANIINIAEELGYVKKIEDDSVLEWVFPNLSEK